MTDCSVSFFIARCENVRYQGRSRQNTTIGGFPSRKHQKVTKNGDTWYYLFPGWTIEDTLKYITSIVGIRFGSKLKVKIEINNEFYVHYTWDGKQFQRDQ